MKWLLKTVKRLLLSIVISTIILNLLVIAIIILLFPHPKEFLPAPNEATRPSPLKGSSARQKILQPSTTAITQLATRRLYDFHQSLLNAESIKINVCEQLGQQKPAASSDEDMVEQIYEAIRRGESWNSEQMSFMVITKFLFAETSIKQLFKSLWSPMIDENLKPDDYSQAIDKLGFYYGIGQFVGEVALKKNQLNQTIDRARLLMILSKMAGDSNKVATDPGAQDLCGDLEHLANQNTFVYDNEKFQLRISNIMNQYGYSSNDLEKWGDLDKPFNIQMGVEGMRINWGWLDLYNFE